MYPGKTGPFIMALGHDFWSNYHDPNGFVLGEYRDPGHSDLSIRYFINYEFDNTNNMYSLYLAREFLDDDVIIMNSDLIINSDIIKLVKDAPSSCVAVDVATYHQESMKVVVDNGLIISISKEIPEGCAFGTSIDVYKVVKDDLPILLSEMSYFIDVMHERDKWTEVLLDKVFREKKINAVPLDIRPNKWFEIDNFDDLETAEMIFNKNTYDITKRKIFFLIKMEQLY